MGSIFIFFWINIKIELLFYMIEKKIMKCTKEEYQEILKDCMTIADFCRAINIKPTGGNYRRVYDLINKYELDISHLQGLHWKLGKKVQGYKHLNMDEILIENSPYKNTIHLKKRLIRLHIKEPICEICGYTDTVELHHINGNPTDNRLENLQILCPNCHAKTNNYRGKNISCRTHTPAKDTILTDEQVLERENNKRNKRNKSQRVTQKDKDQICAKCGNVFHARHIQKYCSQECYKADTTGNRPTLLVLLKDFKNLKSFLAVGKKYGITDNAVRKWCKLYGLPEKSSEMKKYLNIV